MVAHVKEGLYYNRYPTDVFFLLAIEVFGYLHQQADIFFHRCANMAWIVKGTKGSFLLMLRSFYQQIMLMALQRT